MRNSIKKAIKIKIWEWGDKIDLSPYLVGRKGGIP